MINLEAIIPSGVLSLSLSSVLNLRRYYHKSFSKLDFRSALRATPFLSEVDYNSVDYPVLKPAEFSICTSAYI